MESLQVRFEKFIRTESLLMPESTLILAVSGGMDSMVMLDLFSGLRESWQWKLHVAHVNHGLRDEESDGDEDFVRLAASNLGLPFSSKRVDTLEYAHEQRLSKQEAARDLRYEFFEELRQRISASAVATAHQANDNAETVLLNALRGAGVRGLSGIPVRRGALIRPLLFAYREEIAQYAIAFGISYRNDSSNDSINYKRNLLRHSIIPQLKSEMQSDVVESLNRVSQVMRQLDASVQSEAMSVAEHIMTFGSRGRIMVKVPLLLAQPVYLQEALILEVFRQLKMELRSEKVAQTLRLCLLPTGRRLQLSGTIAVYHDRDRLVFDKSTEPVDYRQRVFPGSSFEFADFRFSLSRVEQVAQKFESTKFVETVDAQRLGPQLILRQWQKGDWFVPLGMQSKKKLSDFFTDEKVPLFEKPTIPILESDGAIVWVCGWRLDDRFKVTDQTKSVIKLTYSPNSVY